MCGTGSGTVESNIFNALRLSFALVLPQPTWKVAAVHVSNVSWAEHFQTTLCPLYKLYVETGRTSFITAATALLMSFHDPTEPGPL